MLLQLSICLPYYCNLSLFCSIITNKKTTTTNFAEYAYTLRVDEKSDVYSYGVVLLELITGRRPVGGDFGEGVDIVQWAKRATAGRREAVPGIADRRLGAAPKDEVAHLFFVSMLCVQENSVERPTMREVVQMLADESPRRRASSSSPHTSPSTTSSSPSPSPSPPGVEESGGPDGGGKEPPATSYKLFPDLLA
jgi:serine/threonine protein kinase